MNATNKKFETIKSAEVKTSEFFVDLVLEAKNVNRYSKAFRSMADLRRFRADATRLAAEAELLLADGEPECKAIVYVERNSFRTDSTCSVRFELCTGDDSAAFRAAKALQSIAGF